jgi:predicted GNAT superfamily acetyltransferase
MWSINEQGLPGTGKVSEDEMRHLLNVSSFARGAFSGDVLLGFVICLPPQADYASLNYAWFNARYQEFIYVDRVAVAADYRNQGVGAALYHAVVTYSNEHHVPITAEVNLVPPNPGSMRFHERFDFLEVGVLHHETKSVTMLLRNAATQ